jgi:hypothetical protein
MNPSYRKDDFSGVGPLHINLGPDDTATWTGTLGGKDQQWRPAERADSIGRSGDGFYYVFSGWTFASAHQVEKKKKRADWSSNAKHPTAYHRIGG